MTHLSGSARARFMLLAGVFLASSCSPPPDPVKMGELCYPERSGCGPQVTLERETVLGRNAVDYRLTNTSGSSVRASVQAGPAEYFEGVLDMSTQEDLSTSPTNPATVSQFYDLYTSRTRVIEPGQSITDRLLPSELGREARVWVEIDCEPATTCALEMDYVLLVEPVECTVKEDCPAGWDCDADRGLCAECFEGEEVSSCNIDQVCELGRCTPPQQTSCATQPPNTPPSRALFWLIIAMAALSLRRASGRRGGSRRGRRGVLSALAVACASVWAPGVARADEPRAELSLGVGPRFFTGELGEHTSRGLGVNVGQELRGKYLGAGIDLTAATFLAEPPEASAPPYLRSFITHSVLIGPHAYIPLRDRFELTLDVSYERLGLAANSLVELTGLELGRHGVASSVRARYTLAPLITQVEVGYHVYPALPGNMVSVTLLVGVTSF